VEQKTIVRGFDSLHFSDTLAQPTALWLRAGRGCDDFLDCSFATGIDLNLMTVTALQFAKGNVPEG
jgi:hypothetical protein